MPKLSIIMPTYNGERFLAEQIDSIRAQDDEDFELLVIDDGSTDGTRKVTAGYAERDSRIRVVPSSGNLGQNNRLCQLLGEVRSEYVAISDQDDRWAPDRNSRLFAAMEGRPMALGRSELIDETGELKGRSLLETIPPTQWKPGPDVRLRALIKPMFSAHATITRRDLLTPGSLASPMPFDWMMGLEALFSHGLAYDDEARVFHRIHGGNQVNKISSKRADFSVSYLHWLLMFRTPARLQLWLAFDFLGRSPVLDPPVRRLFRELAVRCHTVWMSEWRSLRSDGGLYATINDALGPFAASPADAADFDTHVRMLTHPPFSPALSGEVWRRLKAR